MFKRFKRIFNKKPEPIQVPEPITNLARVKSNVKIMWTPSKSKNVISQHIKVVGTTGKIFIEKDLDPQDYAFSFSANRDAILIISITPFNGLAYGEPIKLEIKA